ncbi:MAG: hypothetical protein K0B01_09945 [Syntrophobacterales bacterium]|nr:hypothetical protein [Syntrophobacterales bacterium]
MNLMDRIILEPAAKSVESILVFLPNILTSLFIFLTGLVISLAIKFCLEWLFKAIGLNSFSRRLGFQELLKKGGVKDALSLLLAKFFGGVIFLIFTLLAMRALEIDILVRLVEKFLFYLPNIVIALLILLSGWLLGNFLGRTVLIAAVNAGITFSRFVAAFVKYIIVALSVTMALEHVGIGKETVEIAFAVVFSGMVLALSLAFGLGGKDIAKEFLEKKLKENKEQQDDGINHL